MPQNTFNKITGNNNTLLQFYKQHATQQQKLLTLIKTLLPAITAKYVSNSILSGTTLFLYTETSIGKSQLRFYQPSLLKSLTTQQLAIDKIEIHILPAKATIKSTEKPKPPSKKILQILKNPTQISNNKTLQQALLKLAKTLEKNSQ